MTHTPDAQLASLEEAVKSLSDQALMDFSSWLEQYLEARWEKLLHEDGQGAVTPLDHLAEAALEEHRAGKTTLL